MSKNVNPDIAAERAKASFPSREMTFYLDGSKDKTLLKERIRAIVENDPAFSKENMYFNERTVAYKQGLRKIHRVQELRRQLKLNDEETRLLKNYIGETLPTFLHDNVFIPNLLGQMSPEQQVKWVKKAQDYEIIGCYAQTELGHGSNVRGLETTATFIPATDEFEIHSPSLSSTKFWPGGMGRTANFAVVYARLLLPEQPGSTKYKDFGVHPFLVQIRSLEDHKPLRGITAGDIGPKFGTIANDNGFLRFDHVRIPRDQMLMKYSKVDRQGQYSTPPHAKLAYGTMVIVRATIVAAAYAALAEATTISVRYSVVRRQGYKGKSTEESKILDYRMQQYRLLPLIAAAYGLHATGRYMLNLYDTLQKNMSAGDLSFLPEVHATSSGLKSLTTRIASDGIEECRKACGGHGYLQSSGLPTLFGDYIQSVTVEGDNYMLTQQTTRYLLKAYEKAQQGTVVVGNADYLNNVQAILAERCAAQDAHAFKTEAVQIKAFKHRAALLVHQTAQRLAKDIASGLDQATAWNNALVEMYRASNAHCYLTIVVNFWRAVEEAKLKQPTLYPVLERMCNLFALHSIESMLGEFTEDGYFNAKQVAIIRETVRSLLDELRPDAVALVDAFNFSDFELNSTIGRHDGNAYEALMEAAKRNPLNRDEVVDGYEEYLKPMFHRTGIFKANL